MESAYHLLAMKSTCVDTTDGWAPLEVKAPKVRISMYYENTVILARSMDNIKKSGVIMFAMLDDSIPQNYSLLPCLEILKLNSHDTHRRAEKAAGR